LSHSDSTQTDRLLAAIAEGNNSALDKLIRLHAPYLRRILQIRISPELSSRVDVSDVIQETQMVVIRRIDEFLTKQPASFRVWLRSRAIEQLADQYRRHVTAEMRTVRREKRFNDASSMAIARILLSETPSKMLQRSELAEQVRDLIDGLNEMDREMLTLRHAEGLTNNEIAEALHIEPMTARKRYGRALRRLVEKAAAAGLGAALSWSEAK
jgi:RNA polymerase sigma-70 factor (ECF subfamily)